MSEILKQDAILELNNEANLLTDINEGLSQGESLGETQCEMQGVIDGFDMVADNEKLVSKNQAGLSDKTNSQESLEDTKSNKQSSKTTPSSDEKPKAKKTRASKNDAAKDPYEGINEWREMMDKKKATKTYMNKPVVEVKQKEEAVSLEDSDTLNKEFRPSTLADVIGQDSVIEVLLNTILYNKIQSSLILQGPKGTGKTSTARAYAKTLNCENIRKTIEPLVEQIKADDSTRFSLETLKEIIKPCGVCDTCLEFDRSPEFVGVIEIDAGSEGKVDEVRNLKTKLAYVSNKRYQVVIIDEAHNMSDGGKTALLKIIEEPPKNVIFIFATTHPDDILPTIKSRSISLKFNGVDDDIIEDRLREIVKQKNIKITDDALKSLSNTTNGGVRDAIKNLEHAYLRCASKSEIEVNDLKDIVEIEPEYIKDVLELMYNGSIDELLTKLNEILTSRQISIDAFHMDYFMKRIREKIYSETNDDIRNLWVEILKAFLTEQERFAFNVTPRNVIDSAVLSAYELVRKNRENTSASSNSSSCSSSSTNNSKSVNSNTSNIEEKVRIEREKIEKEYENKYRELKEFYESELELAKKNTIQDTTDRIEKIMMDKLSQIVSSTRNSNAKLLKDSKEDTLNKANANTQTSNESKGMPININNGLSGKEKAVLAKNIIDSIVRTKYKNSGFFLNAYVEYVDSRDSVKFLFDTRADIEKAKEILKYDDVQQVKSIVGFTGFLIGSK